MPTYAQLATEPEWRAEYEPEHFANFLTRLRTHYGHTRSQTGAKGDNNHLTGRHRSIAWCLGSDFCTNRSYGTRDQRDLRGDHNALRGFDLGVRDAELRAVSSRVDAAVRAGELPELAEWFGTKDGRTVVGWFEGHASSSDSSHLWHFHGGIWTEFVNDKDFLDRLFATITGDDMTPQQSEQLDDVFNILHALARGEDTVTVHDKDGVLDLSPFYARVAAEVAKNPIGEVTVEVDEAAIAKAVNDDAAARLAD